MEYGKVQGVDKKVSRLVQGTIMLNEEDIEAVFVAAQKSGAAILATPVSSTIKEVENGIVKKTVSRSGKWLAQTPQVFRRSDLVEAFANPSTTMGL